MQVGQNNWRASRDQFKKTYRSYQISKKWIAAAHGYGATENHANETYARVKTSDALQALANAKTEDNEAIRNLLSINLTIAQSLN